MVSVSLNLQDPTLHMTKVVSANCKCMEMCFLFDPTNAVGPTSRYSFIRLCDESGKYSRVMTTRAESQLGHPTIVDLTYLYVSN